MALNQEQYNRLRKRLIMFFDRRGCASADDLADETVFRLLTKLKSSTEDLTVNLEAYALGIAKNVWHENNRNPLHRADTLESQTADQPIEIASQNASEILRHLLDEAARRCVDLCLNKKLTENERYLILNYFKDNWHEQAESRKRLAKELGITPDGLRIKALRILRKLSNCAKKCLNGT